MDSARTVIFYHGGCNDGFGAAYAAWKKFGDTVEYVPLNRGGEPPYETARDADCYFLDFTYEQPVMDRFVEVAKSVTALDHHEGVAAITKSMPNHVFDSNRSGAGIAWEYFHPGEPIPKLLAHVQDDDLFLFALPDTRPIMTYMEVQPQTFETWNDIASKLDDPEWQSQMLAKANTYWEYFQKLADISVEHAKLVSFEGYEILFAYTHNLKSMKSLVGNVLARKKTPIGLVVSAHPEGYGVSIRGDGSVNVAEIAQRFGGNGHPSAAGFLIPREGPFPWKLIEEGYDE